jgi:hypothetical protein
LEKLFRAGLDGIQKREENADLSIREIEFGVERSDRDGRGNLGPATAEGDVGLEL